MSRLQFMGAWQVGLPLVLALLLGCLAFWLYRRQLRSIDMVKAGWLLPWLRAASVAMVTFTLAEPVVESRTSDGELARVTFLLDASRSMSITEEALSIQSAVSRDASRDVSRDSSRDAGQANRFERAIKLLTGTDGILSALADDFELSIVRFDQSVGGEIWNSRNGQPAGNPEVAFDWPPAVWGEATALGEALSSSTTPPPTTNTDRPINPEPDSQKKVLSNDTVVILTDGQSNYGKDPLEIADQLSQFGINLFAIGFGPYQSNDDLALRQLSLPERMYRTDTLSGTATVEQRLVQGQGFTLEIAHNEQIVWQETFTSNAELQREIPFSFPVSPLFASALSQLPAGTEVANLPLKLTARLVVEGGEANQSNNTREGTTMVASHKSRLLLIDGRSRWESRYLKNMFTRDPSWQVDSIILSQLPATATATATATGGDSANTTGAPTSNRIPDTKETLFDYDLVILGEVESFSIPEQFVQWLREYVELTGGGLIIIDGARATLRDPLFAPLHQLSPIAWLDHSTSRPKSARAPLSKRPELTLAGRALDALTLSSEGTAANAKVWASLPAIEFVSPVAPLPGAEVLIEAVTEVEHVPLLVTRRYGAGRVLFSASDETWRWRYKLAEKVHSRLWLQLARWSMKKPLSLRGEFLSLDTGAASYTPGRPVEVRCQLRGPDGLPASKLEASAVVTSGERVVTTLALTEEAVAGTYTAVLESLPPGDYQVHIAASGFSTEALSLQSSFTVIAPPNQEMDQLTCDEETLIALANRTDGKYLRENQGGDLVEILQPRIQGRIKTETWLLWQSYWWFVAVLLLLVAEWILRKRLNLS